MRKKTFAIDDVAELHKEAREDLKQQLAKDERVRAVVRGNWDQAIIATDRRLFVFKRGMMGGSWFGRKMTSWDYRNVNGVYFETGVITGVVAIEVPGGSASDKNWWSWGKGDPRNAPNAVVMTREHFEAAKAGVAEIRRLISEYQSKDQKLSTSGVDEIERLAALHERGHLTVEEFTAKKKQLLGL